VNRPSGHLELGTHDTVLDRRTSADPSGHDRVAYIGSGLDDGTREQNRAGDPGTRPNGDITRHDRLDDCRLRRHGG
jgi:hypothetical protein